LRRGFVIVLDPEGHLLSHHPAFLLHLLDNDLHGSLYQQERKQWGQGEKVCEFGGKLSEDIPPEIKELI
jgi:hypothetical protein